MRLFRQSAFYLGMILGLITVAAAGAVALTYLLTGKLPGVELGGDKPAVTMWTPDEMVAFIRAQVAQARSEAGLPGTAGGENDVAA